MLPAQVVQQIKEISETVQSLKHLGIQVKFNILNENSHHHILQVSLAPASTVFVKGKVIYSNHSNQLIQNIARHFSLSSIFKKQIKMIQYQNTCGGMQIVALSHMVKKDLQVYQEGFYVSPQHLIAAKHKLQNNLKFHPTFSLAKIQYKNDGPFESTHQSLVFQANSSIIEKYLGENESFSVYSGQVIAISETVTMQQKRRHQSFVGPGWIFFQTQKPVNHTLVNLSFTVAWLLIAIFIFTTLLQIQLVM